MHFGFTLADAMSIRLLADADVAGASETLADGTTQLRSASFPISNDLNALWLPAGADQADVDAAAARRPRRITAPDPVGTIVAPAGWELGEERVLFGPDAPPAPPPEVVRVAPQQLHDARRDVWRGLVRDPDDAERLAAMQLALGSHDQATSLAVMEGAEPVAWCLVIAGAIDDVWVQPAARGHGLGRAIVRAAVAAGGWFLGVGPDNAPALALYRSEGFTDAGRLVTFGPLDAG